MKDYPAQKSAAGLPTWCHSPKVIRIKLAVMAVILIVAAYLGFQAVAKPALVTVTGEGRVSVEPEVARFTVVLTKSAPTAAEVMGQGNILTRNAVDLAKAYGAAEEDVQATYLRIVPPTAGVTNDYQAVTGIEVTVKDLNNLDELITRMFEIGANSIGNILFTTENSQELEKEAIDLAIKNAKARAKEIAKSSGKRLGRLRSVTTAEAGEAGALTQKGSQGPTEAQGEIEIIRQASLVYELK
ncbi:SIMPL domain-containing protein [Patescibacteria group bacterium]|nr:SIMPL domain-containing protein [Patescibacteria group bacterium]MBU1931589.1 SIMPL domain-containing protein [Patescibacteria group bacterium]